MHQRRGLRLTQIIDQKPRHVLGLVTGKPRVECRKRIQPLVDGRERHGVDPTYSYRIASEERRVCGVAQSIDVDPAVDAVLTTGDQQLSVVTDLKVTQVRNVTDRDGAHQRWSAAWIKRPYIDYITGLVLLARD